MGVYLHYGAVLYNNGPLTDATVTAQGIHRGQVVDTAQEDLNAVPANSFFVLGGSLTEMKALDDTVEFTVAEKDWKAHDPGVTLRVDASKPAGSEQYLNIPMTITNIGPAKMSSGAASYVVLLDGAGKIVGGGKGYTNVDIPANGSIRDVVQDVFVPRTARKALAYIDLLNAL